LSAIEAEAKNFAPTADCLGWRESAVQPMIGRSVRERRLRRYKR
jgi:hypothetical protein